MQSTKNTLLPDWTIWKQLWVDGVLSIYIHFQSSSYFWKFHNTFYWFNYPNSIQTFFQPIIHTFLESLFFNPCTAVASLFEDLNPIQYWLKSTKDDKIWQLGPHPFSYYEALHRLEHTLDPKKAIFQGHCSNKLDVKLSFVYYIIV